jgi:hypothetical protein
MSYASRFYIPGVELSHGESVGIIGDERLEELTEDVKAWPRFAEVKRGDVISFEEQPYRNTSCFIWDGSKLLALGDVDEYGNVPRALPVTDTEFHPHYWQDAIAHNGIFWLAPEIVERIKFVRHDDGSLRATVKIGEKDWTCIVDAEAGADAPDLNKCVFLAGDPVYFEADYSYGVTFFVRNNY